MPKSFPQFLLYGSLVAILAVSLVSGTIYATGGGHQLDKLMCNAGQVMVGIMYSEHGHDEMSIICEPDLFAAANMIPLHFEQKGIIPVPQDSSLTNLTLLAMWQIMKDPEVEENSILGSLEGLTGHMKRTEPLDDELPKVIFGFFSSSDGITWEAEENFSSNSVDFTSKVAAGTNELIKPNVRYLAFGTYSSFDAVGEIKDVSGTVVVTLPVGYAIQQVLPEPEPPIGDDDKCDKKWKKYYHDGYDKKWKKYSDDEYEYKHKKHEHDDNECPSHQHDDDDNSDDSCDCKKPDTLKVHFTAPTIGEYRVEIFKKLDDRENENKRLGSPITVLHDEGFVVAASNFGKDKLKSNTAFVIYEELGTEPVALMEIHTSCSKPLFIGKSISDNGYSLEITDGLKNNETSIPESDLMCEDDDYDNDD